MRNLVNLFLIAVCLIMTACSKENEPKVIQPIHFDKDAYTVMAFYGASIPYSGGGGVYRLTASNPEVLGKFGMDIETHRLLINMTTIGESTLTIYDVKAESSVTLNITVEDFYLSFSVDEISGDNVNPFINVGDEIRYIRDAENTKQIKILSEKDGNKSTSASGKFDIIHQDSYIYVMKMALHSPKNEESEMFEYTLGGDGDCLRVFETYFWFDWGDDNLLSRSQPVRNMILTLTDNSGNCWITTTLKPYKP